MGSFLRRVLGCIDLAGAIAFLMLTFGMNIPYQFAVFCGSLLFIKSLFIFTGDILSYIDLISSILLILSIFFLLPIVLLWIPAFLLLAKAMVSLI